VGENVGNGVPRRLLGVVSPVQICGALASEVVASSQDPGIRIIEVPDGDANALLGILASLDAGGVVLGLQSIVGRVLGEVHAAADPLEVDSNF
jgi:hypothetical protein